MTAAEVKTPPAPPASSASASAARRLAAGARLAWLHLRSRRVPSALPALALCGGALRAVLHWHLMSGGALAQQVPVIIGAGAAAVIATHGPPSRTEDPGLLILATRTSYDLKVRWYTRLDEDNSFARWLLIPAQASD